MRFKPRFSANIVKEPTNHSQNVNLLRFSAKQPQPTSSKKSSRTAEIRGFNRISVKRVLHSKRRSEPKSRSFTQLPNSAVELEAVRIAIGGGDRNQVSGVRRQRAVTSFAAVQKPAALPVVDLRAGKPTHRSRHVHQFQPRRNVARNFANVSEQQICLSTQRLCTVKNEKH